jgi:hypothetical protein
MKAPDLSSATVSCRSVALGAAHGRLSPLVACQKLLQFQATGYDPAQFVRRRLRFELFLQFR